MAPKTNPQYVYMCTLNVSDAYGVSEPALPKGYESIDFRLPSRGETYLSTYFPAHLITCGGWMSIDQPRLILRKCAASI